jgi:hypothetical protein
VANAQAKYVIKLEDKTKRAFKAIGKSLKRTTSAVFSMKTGFVSAAGIAGIGYFVKKSLDATDEMAKMSRAIGVSVENLQRLRHAASLGGLEATQLDKAVQKLSVNMADMSKGIGLAKDVFEKYNISVENSDGTLRDVVDVMADVADVTSGLTNKTEKADLAYKLFGARGGKMINVLEGGSVAMREAMMEADKLGLVISEKTAKGVEKANDAFTRLGSYLTASFHRAVAKLAPIIEKITNSIREWVEIKIDKAGGIGKLATSMANAVIDAAIGMVKAFESISNAVIDAINNFNDFRKTIPEAMGGLRSVKDIMAEINDEDTVPLSGKWQRLHRELAMVKKSSTPLERVSYKHLVTGLESYKIAAIEAQKPLENIVKTTAQLKDTSWLSDMKDQWGGVTAGVEEYVKTGKDSEKQSKALGAVGLKAAQSMEDAFVNMAMGVKTSFKDMARAIISDLIRIQVRKKLAGFLGGIDFGFGSSGGSGSTEYVVPDTRGTITSFAGGGFTGGGARSGGVDGKGGFPAILHPNETVTDHNNGGGGQPINVTYSPQINALDPRTAATVIAQNAPTIVSVVRQAFNRNGRAVAI